MSLETYLFAKLSEVIEKSKSMSDELALMMTTIRNLIISDIYREEFQAVYAEIEMFMRAG